MEAAPADSADERADEGVPGSIFLHIGPPNPGTTLLHELLRVNRRTLAEHGVSVPADRLTRHLVDGRALPDRSTVASGRSASETWEPLLAVLRAWSGRSAVVSQQALAGVTVDAAQRIVRSFGPAETHVVLTVTDPLRELAASWRAGVEDGLRLSWEDYLVSIATESAPATGPSPVSDALTFTDTAEVLRRWSTAVPAERLHVVTLPPAGSLPDVLWQRFTDLVDVLAVTGDVDPPGESSLSFAGAEVLRRVNVQLGDRLPSPEDLRAVRRTLAAAVDDPHPTDDTAVPVQLQGWIAEAARQLVHAIEETSATVIGDLGELTSRKSEHPATPAMDHLAMLDAGVAAVAGLLVRMAESRSVGAGKDSRPPHAGPGKSRPDAPTHRAGTAKKAAVGGPGAGRRAGKKAAAGAAQGQARGAKKAAPGAAEGQARGAKKAAADRPSPATKVPDETTDAAIPSIPPPRRPDQRTGAVTRILGAYRRRRG